MEEREGFAIFHPAEEEMLTNQDLCMFELELKILDIKHGIIKVLQDLRQDSSHEMVQSAIDRLYALASNRDGTVHYLEGDGKGHIDASVSAERGVQLKSDR